MLGKFRIQDGGQQLGPGTAAGDRVERRRGLADRLACPAHELLAHGLHDLPPPRHKLERLGYVLAQLGQSALEPRTGQVGPGITTRSRGRRAGSGPRTGLRRPLPGVSRLPAGSGLRAASSSTAPASSSSSCNSNWSSSLRPRSDEGAELLVPQLGDQQL